MASVHYKFQSAKSYSSVTIDGPVIGVQELKERISEAKGMAKASDMDLVILNAQTGEGMRLSCGPHSLRRKDVSISRPLHR